MVNLKLAVLSVLLAVTGANTMAVEEAKYTVVLKDDSFEVRHYEPHVLAETIVEGDFDQAGNRAFRRLFQYISGNNTARQKIAMTAPVSQEAESEKIRMTAPVSQQGTGSGWAVSFMMPAAYSLETLPAPKDPKVVLRQVPARHVAAIRFSGSWKEKRYSRRKDELDAWIEKNGFRVTGEPVWARYNPPFLPGFLKRNEILIPIERPADSK